jgi:DNA-binding response OmpR family regulator
MTEINLGVVTLFPQSYEVLREGKKIPLRRKEFELLEFLARNRRRAINRLTILEYVWDCGTTAVTNTLEVHIAALRRKLDGGFSEKFIRTVRGTGYRFG